MGKVLKPWEGLGERLKRGVAHAYAAHGEKITPADLAKAVERSEGTVSLWVNGESFPSIEQAYLLAARVGVSASWLVYEEGAMLAGHQPAVNVMPPERLVKVEHRRRKAK